jgi:hypothetical protein
MVLREPSVQGLQPASPIVTPHRRGSMSLNPNEPIL